MGSSSVLYVELVTGAAVLVLLSYSMARAASFAYFRTKLEFVRYYLQELRKDQ